MRAAPDGVLVLGLELGNGWYRGRLGWTGQRALYGDELKLVNVLKRSTDTAKFAERIYADVLS